MDKRNEKIQNIIWTLLLAAYPFVGVNQGLSVVDTTYSLSNFEFFPDMKGTWIVATYLANALGHALMKLPFGNTMLGMNIYTRFVIVVMAVASYHTLKRVFPAWLTAIAELIAVGLCWAPSTTLYHYLTYFFIQLASLCLYRAFTVSEKERKKWFVAAGVFLGVNVSVRMPNVTHVALILAVWYGSYLTCEDKKGLWSVLWKNTLWCICGYLPGLLIPLAAICAQFGINAYPNMVRTLFAMTEKAQDYKPGAMVTGMFGGYFEGITWMLLLSACVAAGSVAAFLLDRYFLGKSGQGSRTAAGLFRIAFVAAILVVFRFFWGRGMFDLRYYNYGSVYHLTVLFLWITLFVNVYALLGRGIEKEVKLLALLSLLQMFLVPLGGNNGLYPVMNQMFLVLPVTAGGLYQCLFSGGVQLSGWREKRVDVLFPLRAAAFMTAALLFVQSIGFHFCFALQDGVWGEERSAAVKNNTRIAGIYTTETNAQMLEELSAFIASQALTGRSVVLYGEVPGLGYILHMPSALTTFWPDLDSYRVAECRQDLEALEESLSEKGMEKPVAIVSSGIAAWMDDDAQGMQWFGVDREAMEEDEKLGMIRRFLEGHAYEQTFCNAAYAVYQ